MYISQAPARLEGCAAACAVTSIAAIRASVLAVIGFSLRPIVQRRPGPRHRTLVLYIWAVQGGPPGCHKARAEGVSDRYRYRRAGVAGGARLLPRRAARPRPHAPAAPDLDALAAERAADGRAAARAGALVVGAARRRPARAPRGRAAGGRAARHGARLVREQLQRGADGRGAGARVRAGAAAPRLVPQRGRVPAVRRARRAARLLVPRRGAGEADRLRRGRLLGPG